MSGGFGGGFGGLLFGWVAFGLFVGLRYWWMRALPWVEGTKDASGCTYRVGCLCIARLCLFLCICYLTQVSLYHRCCKATGSMSWYLLWLVGAANVHVGFGRGRSG